jgi:four helix bundle protein
LFDCNDIILQKSFEFALNIIEYAELLESKRKYVIATQVLKAGTSIGANINEAQKCRKSIRFYSQIKNS